MKKSSSIAVAAAMFAVLVSGCSGAVPAAPREPASATSQSTPRPAAPSTRSGSPKKQVALAACDLLTDKDAKALLAVTLELKQGNDSRACWYTVPGGWDAKTGVLTKLSTGYEVLDTARGYAEAWIGNTSAVDSAPVSDLGAGAVIISAQEPQTSTTGHAVVIQYFAVVWQAPTGNAQFLAIGASPSWHGARDRVIAAARRIYQVQSSSAGPASSNAGPVPTSPSMPPTGSEATPVAGSLCSLLTQSMASQILGKALPTPETDDASHCEYSTLSADYAIPDGVFFTDEQNLPEFTVAQEVHDLGMVTTGSSTSSTESVSGLSPDAVIVTSKDVVLQPDGSSVPHYSVVAVWKAGDVQKIVVDTTTDPDGTRARLLGAARTIYATEK